jgi:hypothetical protein
MAGRRIPALAELPADPALAARKLARNFVLVEGAHFLMALGAFRSFRRSDVIKGLMRHAPRWRSVTETADGILDDPYAAGVKPKVFLAQLAPFVEWMINEIDDS